MLLPKTKLQKLAWNLGAVHAMSDKPHANPYQPRTIFYLHYNNGYQKRDLFMNRIDLIQAHINKYGYTNYLEVGVQAGHCFRAIECANKTGVDPDTGSAATIHKTSDEFFAENENKFDVIFIDGLHEAPQVEKDILNAIACLVEGGTILMHDCKPTTEFMQRIPLTTQMEWTGDCWKAFVKCRQDLIATHSFRCVDTDWGVGIIRKLNEGEVNPEFKVTVPLTYENFVANQRDWLNLVPVHYFQP